MVASTPPTRPPVQSRGLFDCRSHVEQSVFTDTSNGLTMKSGMEEMPLPKITLSLNSILTFGINLFKASADVATLKQLTSLTCFNEH
jgi:hypothetical protein